MPQQISRGIIDLRSMQIGNHLERKGKRKTLAIPVVVVFGWGRGLVMTLHKTSSASGYALHTLF